MGWIGRNYECACGNMWDDLVQRYEQHEQKCEVCGAACDYAVAAPALATYSMLDAAGRTSCLKKRSREHTAKIVKQEESKFRNKWLGKKE
jgi:hypothetical protein